MLQGSGHDHLFWLGRGPPVFVCLLALEIWAGKRRESATVRARSSFQRPLGERLGKKSASPWARSVSEGRGLARSGAPARIERPEGKDFE
jgi:hypothetical protein